MKQELIESLLPGVFQRTLRPDQPLSALTGVMSELHARDEDLLNGIEAVYSPRLTPERFVPFLARWVDLGRFFDTELPTGLRSTQEERKPGIALGHLRELTAAAAACSQLRGTAAGLLRFLQTATGDPSFRLVENFDAAGQPRLFHLVVYAHSSLAGSRALVERIVQSEKPACLTSELIFEDALSLETAQEPH